MSAPFGIKGWVKVNVSTTELDGLCDYATWWLGKGERWQPYTVLEAKPHQKGLIAQLEGIVDRNAAELLQGLSVAVPREALPQPDEDEFYWTDLIGATVVNTQQQVLGKVINLMQAGAHDLLVVQGEVEYLIPFVQAVVPKVDLANKMIEVEWELAVS